MIAGIVFFGFAVFEVGNPFGRDAVILAGPFAEVYQLASFRAERTPGVIFPCGASTAGWAFHKPAKTDRHSLFE
jgi:hypothetical protein